jgi:exocyst complex component 8
MNVDVVDYPFLVLKLKLANSTEAELQSLQSSLRSAKNDVSSDLQLTVFKK